MSRRIFWVPTSLFQGFEANTSFTDVLNDWYREGSKLHRAIDFSTARNKQVRHLRTAPNKAEMLSTFVELFEKCDEQGNGSYPETAVAVVFECLRTRDDWRRDLY